MRKPGTARSYGWLQIARGDLPAEFAAKVADDEECWESPEGLVCVFPKGQARCAPVPWHAKATIQIGAKFLCHDLVAVPVETKR
jgi:hypothetical protein